MGEGSTVFKPRPVAATEAATLKSTCSSDWRASSELAPSRSWASSKVRLNWIAGPADRDPAYQNELSMIMQPVRSRCWMKRLTILTCRKTE